ncbi:MAG: discoidin domain-containing protein, partial [Algoriphagus sp.]
FPLVYGNINVKDQLREGFREPFSLVKLADFQPGMRETKPDGSLSNVTGSAGNDVFRGDRLPKEIQNQYFYGEPVARIVRQVSVEKEEGLSYLQNTYRKAKSEFIQSSDPLFRPVDIATAPDGTMYIVDMYRGIIQQGNWTQAGSYLRTKIQQYQMDDIAGNGRIWRLTHEGMERNKEKPRMYEETPAELVRHLSHPNGWWRDQAQQLIILSQDKSVVKELEKLINTSDNELARIHALWTLEGLNSLDAKMVVRLIQDPRVHMRIQALRAGESLYKYGEKTLEATYRQATRDPAVDVAIQALLSAYVLNFDAKEDLIKEIMKENSSEGIEVVGTQLLERLAKEKEVAATKFAPQELALFTKGKSIFDSYCSTCHGPKGLGTPTGKGDLLAPAFSGSPRVMGHPEYAVKTLLHGLTGAIEGKEYEGIMIAMDGNDDEYIASVVSYIRNDFGNSGTFVSPEFVAEVRKESSSKDGTYDFDELIGEIPKALTPQDNWKITASSTALQGVGSTKDPSYAFTFKGWKTETPQEPGMWYQVELPKERNLTEIQFNSGNIEYPEAYKVSVSTDGKNWTEVASGAGNMGLNTIQWKSTEQVRFLKIETTEQGDAAWAMKSLTLFAR